MPERAPSMRFRVAASLAALVLLVILVQSVAMVLLLSEKEDEFIEKQLSAQIEHSMELFRHSPDSSLPSTPAMWLYRLGRGEPGGDVPPVFRRLAVGNHEVFIGSKEYHVAVREDDGVRFILAYDVEDHESRLDSLMLMTVSAALALALLTLLAGYLLAGRLTGRLERLVGRVEQETPGPLAEAGMERELLALAEALEKSRDRQRLVLEQERAFAANLSHELRTPLTGIRTDAEMLAAVPGMPEAAVRRGERIIGNVDHINRLASSLLMLARETRPSQLEEIRLQPTIASVWASLLLISPKPVGLQLAVATDSTLRADPTLFELVLRNVLDNALRYSETGDVVCSLNDSRLVVRDTGPGFAASDLERVFDRFFVGRRGVHGLGLALVRHVCTASGWRVSARNAPAGGGEIIIDFGASLLGQ